MFMCQKCVSDEYRNGKINDITVVGVPGSMAPLTGASLRFRPKLQQTPRTQ
ncbi:MAG: hypothetical protein ACHREM_13625 [Polyangiales bacterium]